MVLHRCDSPDNLYPIHASTSSVAAPVALSAGVDLWHARLGHPNPATLRHILRSFSFTCKSTITLVMLVVSANILVYPLALPRMLHHTRLS